MRSKPGKIVFTSDSHIKNGRFRFLFSLPTIVFTYKTRLDKTRQDKARLDKTRQEDKTRQDKTSEIVIVGSSQDYS